jgi:site-specific DNA-methyltransferase (adenine-specific)
VIEPVTIGDATLYCGDACHILLHMPKVDAVVTDPPYGVGFKYDGHDDSREGYEEWCLSWFNLCQEITPTLLMTPGVVNVPMWARLRPFTWQLAWLKPAAMGRCVIGFNNWEPVLLWGKSVNNSVDVFTAPILSSDDVGDHPCPKPVAWGMECVKRVPGTSILDPFMGSGTTGIASIRQGRSYIGIEKVPAYFDLACKRIEQAYKQPDFFVQPPAKPVQEPLI